MLIANALFAALALMGPADSADVDPSNRPKDVPTTREEVKEALDQLKFRKPRLPLAEPTEEEKARANEPRAGRGGLGGGLVNNGRMRAQHLPEELRGAGGFSREPDPRMTLQPPLPTEMFWIVSRINNCHYCLGHQEAKLLADGLSDDRIAALDGDWGQFTPEEQAAFAFTRKLTYEPHRISDADVAALRRHFTELQALEVVFYVARYNSTNRWTDSLGIPQESHRVFKTPTSDKYVRFKTKVAPARKSATGPAVIAPRPELESPEEVLALLETCRSREPRFTLIDEQATRDLIAELPTGVVPQYARLLANFPKAGVSAVSGFRLLEDKGRLSPLMRARIAWICARHDRAWYALGRATARLKELGISTDDMFALDSPDGRFSPAELPVLKLARKLTVAPQLITDADIAAIREHHSDSEVAEVVHRITQANMFDRLTEAAGLALEEQPVP
jgi:alkylhydroperoxidase family enzyme